MYPFRTPNWIKRLYPKRIWDLPAEGKAIYLSFDDGPHPSITPFVLDQLKAYDAKATFFCIGQNVERYPDVYARILAEGHSVGNHTYTHKNGYKVDNAFYVDDVKKAEQLIDSTLFRPPYGRMRSAQARKLSNYRIIMWDLLSGDFDQKLAKEKCLDILEKRSRPGSIVVFHDSEKAWERLEFALPRLLSSLKDQGYRFEKI